MGQDLLLGGDACGRRHLRARHRGRSAWETFKGRYAILRNSARLWPLYDRINDWNVSRRKADARVLDLTYDDTPDRSGAHISASILVAVVSIFARCSRLNSRK